MPRQMRLGQMRLGQMRLGQMRLGQMRLGQMRLGLIAATLLATLAACGSAQHRGLSASPGPSAGGGPSAPASAGPSAGQSAPDTGESPGAGAGGGATSVATPAYPAGAGIDGRVVLINCPVDRGAPPCAGTPVQARLQVADARSGKVAATVDTDAQGRFRVNVPAGAYTLLPIRVGDGPPRRPVATQVTVTAGRYTPITVRLDDGLRRP